MNIVTIMNIINIVKRFNIANIFKHEYLDINRYKEVISKDKDITLKVFGYSKGAYKRYYYDNNGNNIGYIYYNINSGIIGLMWLMEKCRNRGLGKQILQRTIQHMKSNDVKEIYVCTSKNHPFWSNVYNKKFIYQNIIHKNMRSDGYKLKI